MLLFCTLRRSYCWCRRVKLPWLGGGTHGRVLWPNQSFICEHTERNPALPGTRVHGYRTRCVPSKRICLSTWSRAGGQGKKTKQNRRNVFKVICCYQLSPLHTITTFRESSSLGSDGCFPSPRPLSHRPPLSGV